MDNEYGDYANLRPRSTLLNDNQRPTPGLPHGSGAEPGMSYLTGGGQAAGRGGSSDGTEEVMLDENVNPAAVRKTRGKALIIRRGASISSPPPRVAHVFQDTAAVDVLTGTGSGLSSPSADRASLLVRCDPRLARPANNGNSRRAR
ncbi:hypothetical protein FJT64_003217 [Amphibalanus amphitrite]|uniref:Uncharacterized protein n=1 Tax=Amphibalanus amphitrite TaxID=1232801 RepID=A0A6A4W0V3_AMPAM|nr:hypothetical protein FJT64_003217 [Amphibalanus amphitrite]